MPVVPANLVLGLVQRRSPGKAVGPGRVAGWAVVGMDHGLPGRQSGRGRARRIADDLIPQAGADDFARLQVDHGREHIRESEGQVQIVGDGPIRRLVGVKHGTAS